MSGKHDLAGEGPSCPCCVERLSITGIPTKVFKSKEADGEWTCEVCATPVPDTVLLKHTELDLPPFEWPTSAKQIQEDAAKVIEAATANLAAVAAVPDDAVSFDNVIKPLMLAPNYKTNPLVCQSKFLQHCSLDSSVREAAEAAGKAFAAFKAAAKTRQDVYDKVQKYADTPAAAALGPYEAHFVQALVSDFKRGGLALDDAQRAELQRLLDADAACCSKYGSNLGADKTRLTFSVAELEGLPEDFINERKDPEDADRVVLSLKYPDIIPVMANCAVATTREKLSVTRETAYGDNLSLVAEGVGYRKQIAAMLGYPSWSHFVTETRMSGSPEVVVEFMDKIRDLAKDGAAADLEALRQAKAEHLKARGELGEGGEDAVVVAAHDTSFYHNQILKSKYGVDNEAIKEYFPLDHVVEVTLSIYQELLGLSFTEVPQGCFKSWHSSLRLFVVHDTASVERVGHFYLDLHPRDGKYGHAAIFHLLKRQGSQTPVDCMLCNLPGPSPDGKPALLRHADVVTFFHEFGHIMHGLCSEGEGNSTRLAKCPRDFVEAPSQMLENWCWQAEVLGRLSKHHVSGEPLPTALMETMIAAKCVHESVFMMRQIYLATLDLSIHGAYNGGAVPTSAEGLQALVDDLRPSVTGIQNPPGANMLRNFGHLMNQYSAAYYGYMWAEVISADMFATRFEGNCMSPEAGMAYRKEVLAPGGTGKIMEHLSKFLGGRAPEQRAFLKSRGILKE